MTDVTHPKDPIEVLREAVKRACRRSQYRVSVSPQVVRQVLKERDEALQRLEDIEGHKESGVEHRHRSNERWDGVDGRREMIHVHSRGDVAHGHHGWRYGGVVTKSKVKPRISV